MQSLYIICIQKWSYTNYIKFEYNPERIFAKCKIVYKLYIILHFVKNNSSDLKLKLYIFYIYFLNCYTHQHIIKINLSTLKLTLQNLNNFIVPKSIKPLFSTVQNHTARTISAWRRQLPASQNALPPRKIHTHRAFAIFSTSDLTRGGLVGLLYDLACRTQPAARARSRLWCLCSRSHSARACLWCVCLSLAPAPKWGGSVAIFFLSLCAPPRNTIDGIRGLFREYCAREGWINGIVPIEWERERDRETRWMLL